MKIHVFLPTVAALLTTTNACATNLDSETDAVQNTTLEQRERCFARWYREDAGINRYYEFLFREASEASTTFYEFEPKRKCINDAFEYEKSTLDAQMTFCKENQGIWPAKEEVYPGFQVPLREEIEACWQ